MTSCTLDEFNALKPSLVVDPRLPTLFDAAHVEGAVSMCVLEKAIDGKIEALTLAKDAVIIVLSDVEQDAPTFASMLAEKLARAGFKNARYATFSMDKLKVETPALEKLQKGGVLELDVEKSMYVGSRPPSKTYTLYSVRWTGRNLLNAHNGTIRIKSAESFAIDDTMTPKPGATFTLDMTTISDADLSGETWREILNNHLKGHDFFDVSVHPTASFVVEAAKRVGNVRGVVDVVIDGKLTIKGVTQPQTIHCVTNGGEGDAYSLQGTFTFDRTKFDVCYGSGSAFSLSRLAGHLVNDDIECAISLTGTLK